ncbi:uncharacterized protein N7482_002701 [Penicillium canariense]|uniref:Queuine tRNA-ribosyltransferase accessory subunit 2 n=1 Tax=Penicillium canariense TaxID=189055 RepID=A0A9W9LV33_9EURO|nr:uncharacterized protein N7482_002701 [Penicillium canariense]KAJ5176824.1 hypothetical protein N7482_002701 [Penicillium canariense]
MDSELSLPHEMTFSTLGSAAPVLAPRVGKLALAGRQTISTPAHVPLTSRGAVPHISHDMVRKETAINSLYIGLEDFIERKHPAPLYNFPAAVHESPLGKFICAQDDTTTVLGARRFPAIPCPPNNTETSIAISTSVGFRQLEAHRYVEAVQKLKPDIAVGLADLVLGREPGLKRREKMVDRTHAYTRDALEQLYGKSVADEQRSQAKYFAPVLPLDNAQQTLYLHDLEGEFRDRISGLALYESASLSHIPKSLGSLPRLLLSEPSSPHEVLRGIALGADLLTVPFLQACSDAGIALDFAFPVPATVQNRGEPQPLGIDLWSSEYAKDSSPLVEACECYACRKHHRAYFNHLLAAKEMAAWALLQMHNHHVLDGLLAGVRESIQRGTFDDDVQVFNRAYKPELPDPTGDGPRLRGYQMPAAGPNQPRRMPKVYGRLDEVSQKFAESQSSVATPDTDAEGLERHGFAEKI